MLTNWSLVGETVWGGLGGMALEEVCHWSLRFPKTSTIPSMPSLLPVCGLRCELELSAAATGNMPACHHVYPLWLYTTVLVMYDQNLRGLCTDCLCTRACCCPQPISCWFPGSTSFFSPGWFQTQGNTPASTFPVLGLQT